MEKAARLYFSVEHRKVFPCSFLSSSFFLLFFCDRKACMVLWPAVTCLNSQEGRLSLALVSAEKQLI